MKKLSVLFTMLLVAVICFAKNETTVCFTVNPPLQCANCENKVKNNIKFEKGVKAVKPSAKDGIIVVTYDADKTDIPSLIEGFKKIGYDASVCEPVACPSPAVCPESSDCKPVVCPESTDCQPAVCPESTDCKPAVCPEPTEGCCSGERYVQPEAPCRTE